MRYLVNFGKAAGLSEAVTLTLTKVSFTTTLKSGWPGYMRQIAHALPVLDTCATACCLLQDLPVMVEFVMSDAGYVRFFLAPKIDDEAEAEAGMAEA